MTVSVAALSVVVLLIRGGDHWPREPIAVGKAPTDVAVGEGTVWVTNRDDNTVSAVDPVTNEARGDLTPVGNAPAAVAVGAGAVRVANADSRTVTAIDPLTRKVIGAPIRVDPADASPLDIYGNAPARLSP